MQLADFNFSILWLALLWCLLPVELPLFLSKFDLSADFLVLIGDLKVWFSIDRIRFYVSVRPDCLDLFLCVTYLDTPGVKSMLEVTIELGKLMELCFDPKPSWFFEKLGVLKFLLFFELLLVCMEFVYLSFLRT